MNVHAAMRAAYVAGYPAYSLNRAAMSDVISEFTVMSELAQINARHTEKAVAANVELFDHLTDLLTAVGPVLNGTASMDEFVAAVDTHRRISAALHRV